jgi:hypothetical protein
MDPRRAAFRDRIPAELDVVGIEIPAGSRGWLLQDSIAACIGTEASYWDCAKR